MATPSKAAPVTVAKTKKKKSSVPLKYTASTNKATVLSDVVTLVTNVSSNTLTFGFLPPHGKTLTANQTVEVVGDLFALLRSGGRPNKRKLDGLNNAIDLQLVQVYVNSRKIVHCPVASATVVAVGDLVYWDSGSSSVKPAASFTWDTNLATTQAAFANLFVGRALEAKAAGSAGNVKVDISPDSVYSYTCTSETHVPGDTLGLAKDSGNALLNQTLVKAVAASSVAVANEVDTSAVTKVAVRFQSAYWHYNTAGAM